nr:immunoglobulin heavy chain junction region [Macaca mulatta]MOV87220.1 immunoglobulin heavy chain junction region [Macaca mulatta]MOV87300.1 immunoglobulin heavy chain junction region [Macaca mulatta]MOV87587.1 immunoglobulin heavy chain junction region [Macaca mulatta]MOV88128.1 immunoglobulin heavy chain junction region [Macaca mulatta]
CARRVTVATAYEDRFDVW